MTPELFWLTLTVTMTALFWMPYVVNRILELGLGETMANPKQGATAKAACLGRENESRPF